MVGWRATACGVAVLLLCGCGRDAPPERSDLWDDTTTEYLEGERIRFRKPARLKRSSRYFLARDLPRLAADSVRLAFAQQTLEMLEFRDRNLDVFVDTVSGDRFVLIASTSRIDFTNQEAAIFRASLQAQSDEWAALDPSVVRGPSRGPSRGPPSCGWRSTRRRLPTWRTRSRGPIRLTS